jgi:hypothetical protein
MSAPREAKPSEGPKGASPRDCEEADTLIDALRRRSKEADA